ncbi:MAG: tRNA (adenosine(37)-N6)-threonylcarbamoyltransferase complex ATPase subunit type 1 TsaE [Paracoccus sp. (in: a-proteobacteria)]|uniref:tRNA (adenosine(37)-N6)-threonylcarbamoyltransferase complex ATPase subunit type 1 TsaE n=1 Tax=Paracoccus sp. TaxID=267 RepID=UPI0026E034CA|nr:tRNA (adenosine(37)-N6)-threonylcarbamoyltransferase complex ATPase subunit type 1 TsaE [Paracoccus sp. (in: a-proteobacteria)]MDO5632350.1 tRNA (adenosine(37)-N6)-threonylcarbamoyltransferase complex ATPase subunit type 1 TsaE [Paracoccus sp. (in: a-proteobacteria)]
MQMIAKIDGADEGRVAAIARMLAGVMPPGRVLLLDGAVGAGKTHFARAFIRARQGDAAEDVPSPTFTLVQTYDTPLGEVWHADLYRLGDVSELDELGLDEAMAGGATCLIEWPDRLEAAPPGALWLRLSPGAGPDLRDLVFAGDPADWPALSRDLDRAGFADAAGWGEARVHSLAGDASARRYFRLHGAGTAILMDDPPPGSIAAYLAMTGWLRDRGFHAPHMLAQDRAAGFLLIEDLGDDLVARVLEGDPAQARTIYARITDLLADLHRHAPPDWVRRLDGAALADLATLFVEWYPGADTASGLPAVLADLAVQTGAGMASVTSLRDFHAENLIWRGAAPLGLLDFQDAVAAHPAYDLVSALQDARRDVDPAIEEAMIDRYLGGRVDDGFRAAYALLGAQRALRILGIFARLAIRDGKPRYLAMMPRVWGYLHRNLAHPALAPLAALLADVPPPDAEFLQRIAP